MKKKNNPIIQKIITLPDEENFRIVKTALSFNIQKYDKQGWKSKAFYPTLAGAVVGYMRHHWDDGKLECSLPEYVRNCENAHKELLRKLQIG